MTFSTRKDFEEFCSKLAGDLADKGLLVEAGWYGLRKHWLHPATPPDQVEMLRMAFMGGAAHVFFSVLMAVQSDDDEPTAQDYERLQKVQRELERFQEHLQAMLPTEGRA